MASTRDVNWTLWIYAGPGAFRDRAVQGECLPLEEVVGPLPPGVAVLAETVGVPTTLQQLTGEWPAERKVLGLDIAAPKAERDLSRFVDWAEANTPAGSKRSLIVLGDLLQAIGEAPKPMVPGRYRPPYPGKITVRKGTTKWTYSFNTTNNNYSLDQNQPASQPISDRSQFSNFLKQSTMSLQFAPTSGAANNVTVTEGTVKLSNYNTNFYTYSSDTQDYSIEQNGSVLTTRATISSQ